MNNESSHNNTPSTLKLPKLPSKLSNTRWLIHVYRLFAAFGRLAGFSLTLGSVVLAVLALRSESSATWVWIVGTVAAALVVVPIFRIITESDEKKIESIREIARNHSKEVLYYVMYHNYAFIEKGLAVAKRVSILRRYLRGNHWRWVSALVKCRLLWIQSRRESNTVVGQFMEPLTDHLYDQFGFANVWQMRDFLGVRSSALRQRVSQYVDAAAEAVRMSNDPVALAAANEQKTAIKNQARLLVQHYEFPQLVVDGLRIITSAGTWNATNRLIRSAIDLNENRNRSSHLIQEQANVLRSLVDGPRGIPLTKLAGLDPWYRMQNKGDPLPVKAVTAYRDSQRGLSEKFKEYINNKFAERSITVATTDYSDAVCKCLGMVGKQLQCVYILDIQGEFRKDNRVMVDNLKLELGDTGSKDCVALVSLGPNPKSILDHVDLFVFGFEAVDLSGKIMHPRTASRTVLSGDAHLDDIDNNVEIVAVGESWKVIQLNAWGNDINHARVNVNDGGRLTAIVTDHDIHYREGQAFDLGCCQKHWKEKIQP